MRYNIIFCRTLENHSVQNAHHNLINSLGDGTLTDDKVKSAERFIWKLYKVPDSVDPADEFGKATSPEVLLPASDALKFHILGAHYQALL